MCKQKLIKKLIIIGITCFVTALFLRYNQANIHKVSSIYEIIEKEGIDDDFSSSVSDDKALINDEINGLIYFGRDTCQLCRFFNKSLLMLLEADPNIVIYKYDTDKWRDSDSFDNILAKYTVDSIPVLVKIGSDGSYEKFSLDDVDDINDIYKGLKTFVY